MFLFCAFYMQQKGIVTDSLCMALFAGHSAGLFPTTATAAAASSAPHHPHQHHHPCQRPAASTATPASAPGTTTHADPDHPAPVLLPHPARRRQPCGGLLPAPAADHSAGSGPRPSPSSAPTPSPAGGGGAGCTGAGCDAGGSGGVTPPEHLAVHSGAAAGWRWVRILIFCFLQSTGLSAEL